MTTLHRRPAVLLAALLGLGIAAACNPDRADDADPSAAPGAASPSAGIGSSQAPGASASTGGLAPSGTLTTMGFGYETSDDIAQVRVDTFKAAHPDVSLEVGEGAFDEQAFLSSVASGDAPDAVYLDRNLVGTYAARGAITPLTDCIARAPIDMGAYRESAVQQVTLDGDVYAIPEFFNTRLLMIDADVAEGAGVDPMTVSTQDWDALIALNGQLTETDGGDLVRVGFDPKLPGFLPLWAKANGASLLSDDGRESLLDDPKVAEALTFGKQLYDAMGGKASVDAFSQTWDFFGAKNEFAEDQLGAMPMEQWYINVLAENSPDANVVFQPILARDGSPLTYADGNAWAIPSGAANPDAACAFMATMTAADTWIAAAEARAETRAAEGKPFTGTYTANTAADDEIFGRIYDGSASPEFDAGVQVTLDGQEAAFSLPASPAAAEFDKAWRDAVDRVLTDGQDPATALAEADEEAQAALDSAGAP
jgi:multiple sugar transport system substrate-binding protein